MTWTFSQKAQTNLTPNKEKRGGGKPNKICIKMEWKNGVVGDGDGDGREVYLECEESHRVLVRLKHCFV